MSRNQNLVVLSLFQNFGGWGEGFERLQFWKFLGFLTFSNQVNWVFKLCGDKVALKKKNWYFNPKVTFWIKGILHKHETWLLLSFNFTPSLYWHNLSHAISYWSSHTIVESIKQFYVSPWPNKQREVQEISQERSVIRTIDIFSGIDFRGVLLELIYISWEIKMILTW